MKSRKSSQCNETLLVMTVRPGKKFGFQSASENLQRRRRPGRLRQTVPDRMNHTASDNFSFGLTFFILVTVSEWQKTVITVVVNCGVQ